MKESTVTIKMTRGELVTLNEMITKSPDVKLRKQLKDIEVRLDEKIREAINDQRDGEESAKKQTEVETSKGVCMPCED